MGKTESKELIEDEQYKTLREIAESKGPVAVSKHLEKNINKWKKEKVYFAVTGRSATGKSTFINKIRDVKAKDKTFAKSGSGNTTQKATEYENPTNTRIVFFDLPGVGTLEFPKETYLSKIEVEKYDYFFIFFDKVVSEDDYFLVVELLRLKKSFSLVRSKIDEDLRNAAEDGIDREKVLPGIREKIRSQISTFELLTNTDAVFLISSRDKETGDWHKLLEHIGKKLPAPKFESFMFSLPTLTENVIDLKYKTLKKRIKIVTGIAAGVAAVPIPGVDFVANMAMLVGEVLHYISVFGLDKKMLTELEGFDRSQLKCASFLVPGADMAKVIVTQLGKFATILAAESLADFLLPIIGSIVSAATSAVFTYHYLSKTLDDFRDDAVIVYKFILKNQK